MPRKTDKQYPYRTREKIQFRSRGGGTWVGRITTVTGPGQSEKSPWCDLGTNDSRLAEAAYERWFLTGEPPVSERGRKKFEAEAERILDEEKVFLKEEKDKKELEKRRQRLRKYAIPKIGMLEVRFIEPANVTSVLKGVIEDGKGGGTALKLRSDISVILAALVEEAALTSNVALGVPLPKHATIDTRPRMALSDEQLLTFRERRGFKTQIDVMVLLARDVAAQRGSDLMAGRWEHCDLAGYSWMQVRRPKTDEEVGAKAKASRRTRAYEMVIHDLPDHVIPVLREWHERQGRPMSGPMFPLLRDAKSGPVRMKSGKVIERKGGKAGDAKGDGNGFARAYRKAVWDAGIYSPLPGFDPERPDPAKCAFQTDTKETKRLGFHGLRAELATALADAGVNQQTALAITGHTQATTQSKHYMRGRRVKVTDAALPGGRRGKATDGTAGDLQSTVTAAVLAALAAAGQGSTRPTSPAPASPSQPQVPPDSGATALFSSPAHLANSSIPLVSPRGVEPLTRALGIRASNPTDSQAPDTTDSVPVGTTPYEGRQSPSNPIQPQVLGLIQQAAAQAVAEGNWALADQLRALLTPPEGVASLEAARAKRSKR